MSDSLAKLSSTKEEPSDNLEGEPVNHLEPDVPISRYKTFLVILLLLGPTIVGMKICLFSRAIFVRRHFQDPFTGVQNISDYTWGVTNAMFPVGACFGTLLILNIANLIGVRYAVALCIATGLVGQFFVVLSYYLNSFVLFIFSRVVDGLSAGSMMNVNVCYFFALLPPRLERQCQPLIQLCINLGLTVIVTFSLDALTHTIWVRTSIPLIVVQVVYVIFVLTLPESPTHVYKTTKDREKTRNIILWLRGSGYKNVDIEVDAIVRAVEDDANTKNISIFTFLTDRSLAASIFVMAFVQIFQQLSGVNTIIFFTDEFIKAAGFTYQDLGVLLIISLCLLGSIVFIPLLNRVNSKIMLVCAYSGMSLCFFAAFLSWMLEAPPIVRIVCLGGFLLLFQAGPGPKPWTIIMETYLPEQRLAAQGFFTFCNWTSNTLVTVVFMFINKSLDFHVSELFGIINLLIAIFFLALMVNPTRMSPSQLVLAYQRRLPCLAPRANAN